MGCVGWTTLPEVHFFFIFATLNTKFSMRNLLLLLSMGLILFSCTKSTKFKLLTSKETGIDFTNTITETDSFHVMSFEYIYNGAGVGIGDLNNDGLQDIFFAGNLVSSRVYLNEGNFKFKDITSNFAGLTNSQWYSGVTLVDINGDGWIDVYLTSTAGKNRDDCKNRLWVNNGLNNSKEPTFTEMAEKYGIAHDGQSVNAAFLDYDKDGDLDLYVLNNTVTKRENTNYRVKILDGSSSNNDRLFRNNGDDTFTDVTIQAGIVCEGFGLGLAVGDVNKDGYPDIYVSNDYMSNDLLYINQGNGTFRNEIRNYLSYQTKSSMGNDMADVNNDGFPDIYTLDMLPQQYYKKKQTINGFSYIFYIHDAKFDYEHQYLRNMLHLHNGFMHGEMLPYSEVGQMMGIYHSEWSWSPLFADYDNDGDKDLLIANGYPKDMTDKDWTRMKAKVYGSLADEKYVIDQLPASKVPNIAYENTGRLSFVNRSKEWLPHVPSYSYGASFVDLDNDGDLDYVTNNLNDEAFILKNTTVEKSKNNANYLKIKLKGIGKNTMAFGAKTEIWSNGKYQYNEHFLTRGYASSVDPVIHFGLSSYTMVDSVIVTWPSTGSISILTNVKPDQTIEIDEKDAQTSRRLSNNSTTGELLFTKTDSVINYTHEQIDFSDFFQNQSIIPHKFSQIGPVMAKGDLNNDGLEDLIIGATNKLPTKVFMRNGHGFKETNMEGLSTPKAYSEAGIAVTDIDNDGDKDVVIVAGGYENRDESEYQHYLYTNKNGSFTASLLPVPAFPASVVKPFDFDHDGDPDLFVGSRVKKGMFPYSNSSWLIINDKGKLSTTASTKLNLGMVTDAVWSDVNKDGWEDLIVTREWNSIAILLNKGGKELDPQILPGMEEHQGMWYSIINGDFDNDGDDDYIVGNLGENHRFTISDEYPLNMYAIDLDLDGNLDPVMSGFWKDKDGKMKEYPVNYLDELLAQSSFFRKKISDYTSFSYMSLDQIFDRSDFKRVDFKLNVNTSSSYILWNDGGKLRWEKLPGLMQSSPLTKMVVTDVNGDNFPDVVVAGNDYTYDVSTGYYDACKGFVLESLGKKQGFDLLLPPRSGALFQGMAGSLLCFEGDTTLIVAGFNRAKTIAYRLNRNK
jgi:enediyne biosynthesis protein E4